MASSSSYYEYIVVIVCTEWMIICIKHENSQSILKYVDNRRNFLCCSIFHLHSESEEDSEMIIEHSEGSENSERDCSSTYSATTWAGEGFPRAALPFLLRCLATTGSGFVHLAHQVEENLSNISEDERNNQTSRLKKFLFRSKINLLVASVKFGLKQPQHRNRRWALRVLTVRLLRRQKGGS